MMEFVKIVSEKDNALFARKEVSFLVKSNSSPSNKEVLEMIVDKFKSEKDAIKIKRIKGNFGKKEFLVEANIYDSNEKMMKTENFSKKEIEFMEKLNEPKVEKVEEKKNGEEKEIKTKEGKETA